MPECRNWARSSLAAVQNGPTDPPKLVIDVFGPRPTFAKNGAMLPAAGRTEADLQKSVGVQMVMLHAARLQMRCLPCS
jgi:hypothetical protein